MAGTNPLERLPGVEADLAKVEDRLLESVHSTDPFLTDIASHLILAGGKRVRPGFCIAAAATGFDAPRAADDDVLMGAVSVELVHLGSLYHDDVMDDSPTRRSVESVNSRWGNHRAILAGDYLLARASEIAASLGVEVAGLLASTIARLCEGQLLELRHTYDTARTEDEYLRSIDGKTAALLASACRIGGIVGGLPRPTIDALTTFGRCYGLAFQIVDDVLDLTASAEQLGKPAGHDLVEGVYTLPVLRTLAGPDGPALRELLAEQPGPGDLDDALALVRGSGQVEAAVGVARTYANEAQAALLELLPSPGLTGLTAAADHLIDSVEAAAV